MNSREYIEMLLTKYWGVLSTRTGITNNSADEMRKELFILVNIAQSESNPKEQPDERQ